MNSPLRTTRSVCSAAGPSRLPSWCSGQAGRTRSRHLLKTNRHRGTVARPPPSRPGEFHSEPPTDPDVNLSIHPARATQRRLPPSIKTRSSSGFPLTPPRRGWPAPFAPRELPRFLATTKQCAPDRCVGTFGLVGCPLVPFSLASPTRFSSSVRKPR
jgi:hypothetical protein